ncbi:MAG: HesA/MoeB/ThiF family protein [Desulfobacteraceae bacterium]
MAIHNRVQNKARSIKDPAGREVRILEDAQAIKLADASGFTVHDVYRESLKAGVYPYRYIRNRDIISMEEQLKLAESRVAVIGVGGLGGNVILLLARLGIGHLVVVDRDIFDETNLNRQALCSRENLGQSKSGEALALVALINPGVVVTAHQTGLDAANGPDILAGCDVIVDALDTVSGRLMLEEVAKSLEVPLVHGALAGFQGQLMTIMPGDAGLKKIYMPEATPEDGSHRPEAVLGVPSVTASFVATLQVMEVIKILLGRGKPFRNMMVYADLEEGELNQFSFDPR